jgi:hypothetical protein
MAERIDVLARAFNLARQQIEIHAEEGGYGFARPANPHHFSPDLDCCTDEEIANHKAACDAFDAGTYKHEASSGWSEDGTVHMTLAPWGIGSYVLRDAEADEAIRALNGAAELSADLIDFLRDADCNCRAAPEKYEGHTCRRCELLARIEP